MHYPVGISLLLHDLVSWSCSASVRVFDLISAESMDIENSGVVRGQGEGKKSRVERLNCVGYQLWVVRNIDEVALHRGYQF